MAEPIALAASVIEVTNTGFALGKFLNETWLSYRNAPAEVLEIAHDVTICCELMSPLGEQLKTASAYYTSRFKEAVEGLVKNASFGLSSLLAGVMLTLEYSRQGRLTTFALSYPMTEH
jgi:hypothetical protein